MAIRCRKLDFDQRILEPVDRGCPTVAWISHRADRLLLLPVNREIPGGKTTSIFDLPVIVSTRWPKQIDSKGRLAADKQARIHLAGIRDRDIWEQVVFRQ